MTEDPENKTAAGEGAPGEPATEAKTADDVADQREAAADAAADFQRETEAEPEAGPEAESEADPEDRIAELNDKLLRMVAELENYRRRAEKERQDTAKYAIAGFARDCLTVMDNLRRGLDSVSTEERGANQALETLAAGMELTERELISTLERHGIQKIDALGTPFDYDRHQAMFEVEDASTPAGTVVQEVQPGYMLNERLLRPSMVGVAKGGPKPVGEATAAPGQGVTEESEGDIGSKG
jgi:molecular chaperone GrpE